MPISVPFAQSPQNQTSGVEVIISNLEHFERNAILQTQYADNFWPQVVPQDAIDTTVPRGALFASRPKMDKRGRGEFMANGVENAPTVSISMNKISLKIQRGGVDSELSIFDADRWEKGWAMNVGNLLIETQMFAYEKHREATVFFGDADVDMTGWLQAEGVAVTNAVNGAGGSPLWINKTPLEIVFDLNSALTDVWAGTLQKFLPNVVYLPTAQFSLIVAQLLAAPANVSIFNYIKPIIFIAIAAKEMY